MNITVDCRTQPAPQGLCQVGFLIDHQSGHTLAPALSKEIRLLRVQLITELADHLLDEGEDFNRFMAIAGKSQVIGVTGVANILCFCRFADGTVRTAQDLVGDCRTGGCTGGKTSGETAEHCQEPHRPRGEPAVEPVMQNPENPGNFVLGKNPFRSEGIFPQHEVPRILRVLHYRLHGRFSPRAVRLLAVLCSFSGGLPTGAPTSPAIANQVLSRADRSIRKAAEAKNVCYTRYADDLTFSGDGHEPVEILPFVEEVVGQLGYQLDPKKTNFFRKGRRQCVTGLVVNQKPNLAKPLRRRLRAAVHRYVHQKPMEWHGRPMNLTQLLGRLGFLAQTQPEEAKRLKTLIQA